MHAVFDGQPPPPPFPLSQIESGDKSEFLGPKDPNFNVGLDAHMASLNLLDGPIDYKGNKGGESARSDRSDASRGKRYSQAVRSRMEERQKQKPPDVN